MIRAVLSLILNITIKTYFTTMPEDIRKKYLEKRKQRSERKNLKTAGVYRAAKSDGN